MAGACLGIALGAVVAFLALGPWLGPEAWQTLAALCGTWTGGSANLLAVSVALGVSADAQGVAILVDTLVTYSWMAFLVALSARQATLDRWLRADRSELAAIGERVRARAAQHRRPTTVADATLLVGLATVVSVAAMALGRLLPPLGTVLNAFSWGILILTTTGLVLSLVPAIGRLAGAGATSLGYAAFFVLVASVGAQADLARILARPMWVLAGAIVFLVHGAVLFLTLRLLRAPSFFFGAASQAAAGGVASAPLVAEIYQPGLAPVGLLLAVLGNLVGTYVGLGVGQLLASW
jgi:uncharacterized membrane protein